MIKRHSEASGLYGLGRMPGCIPRYFFSAGHRGVIKCHPWVLSASLPPS